MRRKNDQLWKSLLEDVFDDLLRFVFPEADKVFDMQRGFEYLDKELNELTPKPDKGPDTRFVDKLVKVCRRDGKKEFILIHIEVQGATKKREQFPERMFQYYYRIFDRQKVPITAIAIFTGPDGHKIPDRYEYHFLGTTHIYKYNTLNILGPKEQELEESNNPFAIVLLAARKALLAGHIPEKMLLDQKLLVARSLLAKKQFSHKKIKAILVFLRNYIVFAKKETSRIFDKQINKITHQNNSMGIVEYLADIEYQKGIAEATEKTHRQIVVNLLKGTGYSMAKIADLAGVSIYFVKKVKASLKTKTTRRRLSTSK
jgi:DNA-binding CsgD family transcriptional regulator